MTAHLTHFPGRPSRACHVPSDTAPMREREARHIDTGEWTPADTRGFFKGLFLFALGAAAMWALIVAIS